MKSTFKVFIQVVLIFLLISQHIFSPISVSALSSTPQHDSSHLLYQAVEEIKIEDKIAISPDTYLYGLVKEETPEIVSIQYGTEAIEIDRELLNQVEITEEVPVYREYNEDEDLVDIVVKENQALYVKQTEETNTITFLKETNYPSSQDKLSNAGLLIGNVTFYLVEEDENDIDSNPTSTSDEISTEQQTNEESDDSVTNEEKQKADQELIEEGKQEQESISTSDEIAQKEETEKLLDSSKTESNENKEDKSIETSSNSNPWETSKSKYFKVNEASLPVYDNRSGNLVEVGKLLKDQVYPRISAYGSNWHKIQYGNIDGFVYAPSTSPAVGSSLKNINSNYQNKSQTFTVLQTTNVYDNSTGSLVPFGTISKEESYPIVGDYGSWWRVLLSDRVGYVNKGSVRLNHESSDNYFRVLRDNLPIYDNRNGKLIEVGSLTEGQVYPRISAYGSNWHKIQFGTITGFVYAIDTESASGQAIKNQNTNYSNQARTITPTSDVPVYDNTSGKLVEFGKVVKGNSYPIVSDYGNWWRIILSDRVGYVSKDAVDSDFTIKDKYFQLNANLPVYDNRGGKLKKVGELEKGQIYPRLSDYGQWHRIQFGDYDGYVSKSGTSPASGNVIKNLTDNQTYLDRKIYSNQPIKVYDNSNGNLTQFGTIEPNVNYVISKDFGNWWQVTYANRVGYINKSQVRLDFITGENEFKVTSSNLPVYDNRSGELEKVGELQKNQVYKRLSNYGNWHKIQFGNYSAYVNKAGTEPVRITETTKLLDFNQGGAQKYITINDTIVYDNSDKVLKPLGNIDAGQYYYVNRNYGGNWLEVSYLGRKGYISKSNVEQVNRTTDELVEHYSAYNNSASMNRIDKFLHSASSNYVDNANSILDNKFYITPYGTFNLGEKIDWKTNPTNTRSYYRSLHSHFFIYDLVAAYKETDNPVYIKKGYSIIKDWIESNPRNNPEHYMAWHDEGTARRLETWINFFDASKEVLSKSELNYLFKNMVEHANLLSTDSFYTKNTNHGMFQDQALVSFSDYFGEFEKSAFYKRIAESRMKDYFSYIISSEGVHLEHSPEYNQLIVNSIVKYKNYYDIKNDISFRNYLNYLYESMVKYSTFVTKPNGFFPNIGDTFYGSRPDKNLWTDNPYYQFAATNGESGEPHPETNAIFKESGYAIFRDDWEKGDDATYVHFTAAYHTSYHKHTDDLSVWIYANGKDLVSEAGPNGYDYDHPFTEYGYSSSSHNTLVVENKSLPRVDYKFESVYIEDYDMTDENAFVTGVNKRYEDIIHKRRVEYNKNNDTIKVKDNVTSNSENNYKILWNLAEGVIPVINGNEISIMKDGQEEILLTVSGKDLNIYSVEGQENPILGWHFKGIQNPYPTHTIVIEVEGVNTEITSSFQVR